MNTRAPARAGLVLFASVLGIFVGFGSLVIFSFGVFLKPVSGEFGWSRAQVSLAFTLAALMVAAASPFIGRIADRIGPRRVMLPCVFVYAAAFSSLALVHSLVQYYALYLVLGLVGNGTAHLCYARVVSSWFDRRRGAALATVMAGAAAGAIAMPPLATGLIARYGWRPAYLILGLSVVAFGLIPAALFVEDAPPHRPATEFSETHPRRHTVTAAAAARTSVFWLLLSGFFLFSIGVNGSIAHLAPMLTDRGIGAGVAALAVSILGIFTLSGRLVTGALLDRFPGPPITAVFFSIAAVGVAVSGAAFTREVAFLGAALIGLGMGAEADVLPYLISRYFGLRNFTEIYGYAFTSYAVAGAAGPLLMGWSFDHWHSYLFPTRILAASMLAGALLLSRLPRNRPEAPPEAAVAPVAA